jgi:hypothetical protein
MIRRRHIAVLAQLALPLTTLLGLAPALGGCGLYTRPTAEDREARHDCDAEADRIFAARNRYQLSERNSTDTPYSGNTLPSNPTAGLSDQYERDTLVDNCLNHSAAGEPAAAPAATPPGGPATSSTTPSTTP